MPINPELLDELLKENVPEQNDEPDYTKPKP